MKEWKYLKLDALEPDIITGNYEWEFCNMTRSQVWLSEDDSTLDILERVFSGNADHLKFRYRKLEPKAPTHKEIMTKFWREDCGLWRKVSCYGNNCKYNIRSWKDKAWFAGRESADIPPEAE